MKFLKNYSIICAHQSKLELIWIGHIPKPQSCEQSFVKACIDRARSIFLLRNWFLFLWCWVRRTTRSSSYYWTNIFYLCPFSLFHCVLMTRSAFVRLYKVTLCSFQICLKANFMYCKETSVVVNLLIFTCLGKYDFHKWYELINHH